MDRNALEMRLEAWLDGLDATGRWALLKLLTGALRVGVSARLAKTAVAEMAGKPVAEVEEIWHGIAPPYLQLFRWLEGLAERPDVSGAPVFRPLMLAHPLEDADWEALDIEDFAVEWKWDGIRVQVAAGRDEARLFSRAGDDISRSFPDLMAGLNFRAVLDGELLIVRGGEVAPFNDLQQRLNRKTVTTRMLADYPAHIPLLRCTGDRRRGSACAHPDGASRAAGRMACACCGHPTPIFRSSCFPRARRRSCNFGRKRVE